VNIFAAVIPTNGQPLEELLDFAKTALHRTVPAGPVSYTAQHWSNEFAAAVSCSIHAEDAPIRNYVAANTDEFLTFNGMPHLVTTSKESWAETLHRGMLADDFYYRSLGGYYNLLYVTKNRLVATTCLSRIEPMYWIRTANAFAVGNRPSLVYSLANSSLPFE